MFRWLTEHRRRRLLEEPFPEAWTQALEDDVAHYRRLPEAHRKRLRELVQVFVAEKSWEGAGGLELTDRIRVVIAGQACLMILERDHDLYRNVDSIVVYPSTIMSPGRLTSRDGVVLEEGETAVHGEAHLHGPVILSWNAVKQGAYNAADGRNVVFHEFAHKLDMLDGAADGTPPIRDRQKERSWNESFSEAYLGMVADRDRGKKVPLDDHALSSPAEFFAAATERFFEQPKPLRAHYPSVYEAMKHYFGLDPAEF